jgi:choline dehydrogenase-like flavoprotein
VAPAGAIDYLFLTRGSREPRPPLANERERAQMGTEGRAEETFAGAGGLRKIIHIDMDAFYAEPGQWPANLGTERDWGFEALPNPLLNGRRLPLPMGKVLGGGSSINAMAWARGHKNDWDYFAEEAGDPSWGYESILGIFRSPFTPTRKPCATVLGNLPQQAESAALSSWRFLNNLFQSVTQNR